MQLPAPITHGCPEVRKAQKVVASASAASSRSIPKPADLNETDFLNATEGWLEFGPASSADAGMVYPGMELWQTANGGRSWIRKDQIPGQSRIVAGTVAFTSRNDGWMRGESPRARLDAYHERRTHLVQGDTRGDPQWASHLHGSIRCNSSPQRCTHQQPSTTAPQTAANIGATE